MSSQQHKATIYNKDKQSMYLYITCHYAMYTVYNGNDVCIVGN